MLTAQAVPAPDQSLGARLGSVETVLINQLTTPNCNFSADTATTGIDNKCAWKLCGSARVVCVSCASYLQRDPSFFSVSLAKDSRLPAGMRAPVTELFRVLAYSLVSIRTGTPWSCSALSAFVTRDGLPFPAKSARKMTLLFCALIDRRMRSVRFMVLSLAHV